MRRWFRHVLVVVLLAGGVVATRAPATQAQVDGCQIVLGFRALQGLIPSLVGRCLENEWHNAFNGDGLQRTTGGLLVWRKLDNWTAFTDGYMTWINGPFGLQARLNSERFAWEWPAPSPGVPGDAISGSGGAGGTASGGAVATPTPNSAPSLNPDLPDGCVTAGERVTIRLSATDDDGVEGMWWWATGTGDQELRNTHTFDCVGATRCRQTWDISTTDTGTIEIHARARDVTGRLAEEETADLRVREASTPTPTLVPTATPTPTT